MRHTRSLLLLAASAGLAGCGDQASKLAGPTTATEFHGSSDANSGGYTWTIKKEMVAVYMETPDLTMVVDPVTPYSINLGQTKWFTYRITYTRTSGGNMGPTAVISDDMAAACATLGSGYECTSQDSDFGLPGTTTGQIGTKTWTVSSSGFIQGMLDIKNKGAGCPGDRKLKNTATLNSNGSNKSSTVETPVNSPDCGSANKPACNQGVGNGPEGCDPGNSDHNQPSNDENGGTPGNPGRKGGH